jgi:ABC-type polysaccharide/polyol phosphate export permease
MNTSTGTAKTAGRLASLICAAGVVAFFVGIFGGPRSFAIIGVGLMAASLVGFFAEEHFNRKANYRA